MIKIEKLNEKDKKYVDELYNKYSCDESIEEFCEEYLMECELCGEICFIEDCEQRTMLNGEVCKCCETCCEIVDESNEKEQEKCYDCDSYYEEMMINE